MQVLTYHGAKGLEWPVVILAGLNSGSRDSAFGVNVVPAPKFDPARPLANRSIRFWPGSFGPKAKLDEHFNVPSDRFEHIWEYEQYVRLAEPAWEALLAVDVEGTEADPVVLFAHEYMGMPTAMRAMLDGRSHVRTIFYAHEIAPVRRIVEDHPGHDLMFYSLLQAAEGTGKCLEDFFPESRDFYKHPLVRPASHCDATFAVGGLVAQEMRFRDGGGHGGIEPT